ncbi:protein argonaute-3-like [Oppia nitens]|uniref:protein argonaute-3-like n=1 Tax=Oppia nitens TaxID=1686743 RepID=UPI0023DCB2B5|nr:protein argonaute-3-like [Oppia nitens]
MPPKGRKKGSKDTKDTKSTDQSSDSRPQQQPIQGSDFPTLGQTSQSGQVVANNEQTVRATVRQLQVSQTIPTMTSQLMDSSGSRQSSTTSDKSKQTKDTKKTKDEDLAKEIKEKMTLSLPKREHQPFSKRPGKPLPNNWKSVALLANHFVIRVGNKTAYHYDISIEKEQKVNEKDKNLVDKNVDEAAAEPLKQNRFSRKLSTALNRRIFERMIELYSQTAGQHFYGMRCVYDGQKNMFTSREIIAAGDPEHPLLLIVNLIEGNRETIFKVSIKKTEPNFKINTNILNEYNSGRHRDDEAVKRAILFIDILIRHNSTNDMVPIGQSIFDPKNPGQELSRLLNLKYGFYTTVRNLMAGPTLNIDRSAAAFLKPDIKLIIESIVKKPLNQIPGRSITNAQRIQIKKELSGLQVESTHINYGTPDSPHYRKFRIIGISRLSAAEQTFEFERDKNQPKVRITIQQYFKEKYRINLQYPHLPCLEVGNPRDPNRLPIEVCRLLPDQRVRRSLTNEERSKMTMISGQMNPSQRFDFIMDCVKQQFHSNDEIARKNRNYLSDFSINIDKELLKVNSKVIPAPTLKYKDNNSVRPRFGEWEMFREKAQFYKAINLTKWIIINISMSQMDDQNIKEFSIDLCSQGREMGMNVNNHGLIATIRVYDPMKTFAGIKNKISTMTGLQMILFMTPLKTNQYSDDIYSQIKLLGDVTHGLTTQCVNIANIWDSRSRRRKWNRSYLRQLMLKINPKLGGINVALLDTNQMSSLFKKQSVMIVGADVNHPAPADKVSPSIAAVVGSFDIEFSKFCTTISMQPKSREEMIRNLDKMVVELLNNYKVHNNCRLPESIVFYRDGVSEGQFQHVIDNEYPLITKAFDEIGLAYKPKLTFIVVQKRHHTRFVVIDEPNYGRNVEAGTVVESGVTHKYDYDFYLCSHNGRIGTSRAAHYYVLADENGFSTEDMCKMTYYLCHTYQRCTKSVSIPAPVYYADLAAYRAKVHAMGRPDQSDTVSEQGGGDDERSDDMINTYRNFINVNPTQKLKLYYM